MSQLPECVPFVSSNPNPIENTLIMHFCLSLSLPPSVTLLVLYPSRTPSSAKSARATPEIILSNTSPFQFLIVMFIFLPLSLSLSLFRSLSLSLSLYVCDSSNSILICLVYHFAFVLILNCLSLIFSRIVWCEFYFCFPGIRNLFRVSFVLCVVSPRERSPPMPGPTWDWSAWISMLLSTFLQCLCQSWWNVSSLHRDRRRCPLSPSCFGENKRLESERDERKNSLTRKAA